MAAKKKKKSASKQPKPKKAAARKILKKKSPLAKSVRKAAPKVARATEPRKPTGKQRLLMEGIESVKMMAIFVPPNPGGKMPDAMQASASKSGAASKKSGRKTAGTRADRSYNPQTMEKKWQAKWEADKLYRAVIDDDRPKHYALTMLPYTSGDLHFGHWYPMAPSDARARYKRMNGYNVLFPIGFDAFGLPAENAAIKRGVHPKQWTFNNIDRMRNQLRGMGAMFDWEREAITADPDFYRWSEWFFIQLFKAGLAYRKMSAVDWCPKDNTTLAREQVIGENRVCERCGTPVIKKELEQWFFKSTKYTDELLDFSELDWPERVKTLQTNWIGRSEGARVTFKADTGDDIEIFTTRPDTLWGATFMVFSPEHPFVDRITTLDQKAAVQAYKQQAARHSDIERESLTKEKTGVFSGDYAINPVNSLRIPIWIADYVLMSYGSGAIMAVPAHDERDFAFAVKYEVPIVPVIRPEVQNDMEEVEMQAAYIGPGVMINSGPFNGTKVNTEKGRKNPSIDAVIKWLEEKGIGKESVNYRYRDWLISRQRYWGAPIPMIHCEKHGWNPMPEDQLPLLLPDDIEWKPTGESPLKLHPTWKDTTCPICAEPAIRETDTMDTFMCSSWYHLRYLSPHYHKGPFEDREYNYWMPVDTYTGGIEHATMHLLYVRFFHKALRDAGIVEGNEPMLQLRNQGIILGEDGDKMSKSKGNVVSPDGLVARYGADALRTYLMFAYRWQEGGPWNPTGIDGTARWLRRTWALFTDSPPKKKGATAEVLAQLRRRVHQTLGRVTRDFEQFEFNTIISSLMELLNEMYTAREAGAFGGPEWNEAQDIYLKMLAPVAPHIAEEIWSKQLGKTYSVHQQEWPKLDEAATREDTLEIPVQVNGKLRGRVTVASDAGEEEIKAAALASEPVQKFLNGQTPKRVIVANGRLVNIVV